MNLQTNLLGFYGFEGTEVFPQILSSYGSSHGTFYGSGGIDTIRGLPSWLQIYPNYEYGYFTRSDIAPSWGLQKNCANFPGDSYIDLGQSYLNGSNMAVSLWFPTNYDMIGDLPCSFFSRYFSTVGMKSYNMGIKKAPNLSGTFKFFYNVYTYNEVETEYSLMSNYIYLAPGAWNHVVFSKSGSLMKIYLNNVEIASANNAPANINIGPGHDYIKTMIGGVAKSQTIPDCLFMGKMDNIGVWSAGLGVEEVNELFHGGPGSSTSRGVTNVYPFKPYIHSPSAQFMSNAINLSWVMDTPLIPWTITPAVFGDGSPNEGTDLYRSANGGEFVKIGTLQKGVIHYTDYAISPNTNYTYKIIAYNPAGYSWEKTVSIATPAEILSVNPAEILSSSSSGSYPISISGILPNTQWDVTVQLNTLPTASLKKEKVTIKSIIKAILNFLRGKNNIKEKDDQIVSKPLPWLTASPSIGTGEGSFNVNLLANNSSTLNRYATISVRTSTSIRNISVTQYHA